MRGRFCIREKHGRGKGCYKWRGGKIGILGTGGDWEYSGCSVMEVR